MTHSIKATVPAGMLILGLILHLPAIADDAQSPQGAEAAQSCRQMLDQAQSTAARMPAGVEKLAAQKELASAKIDMDKGDMTSCKSHIKNALGAMHSK